ncbi:MAG: hypothetical protein U1C46_01315 [Bacteroidales bacterium]|nr:hypothetical protein [Bacteroidales bacterium]MDZ4203431.1 hypothetical protein [Bacteroidales bacterium]
MTQKKTTAIYRRNLLHGLNQTVDSEADASPYSYTEYDQKGNVLEQKLFGPDGKITEHFLDDYGMNGFLIREKYTAGDDETTEEKSYERNENGLILKEYKHYADGSVDTTTYRYDSQHRIISKITVNDEDEPEMKELFGYRGDFLAIHEVFDAEDNLLSSEEFSYDEHGNAISRVRWDSESDETLHILITYTDAGRKKEESVFDEEDNLLENNTFDEDGKGRLIRLVEQTQGKNTTTHYEYDDQGNMVLQAMTNNAGDEVLKVVRCFNENNELTYSEVFIDGEGRMLSQHYEVELVYTYYRVNSVT